MSETEFSYTNLHGIDITSGDGFVIANELLQACRKRISCIRNEFFPFEKEDYYWFAPAINAYIQDTLSIPVGESRGLIYLWHWLGSTTPSIFGWPRIMNLLKSTVLFITWLSDFRIKDEWQTGLDRKLYNGAFLKPDWEMFSQHHESREVELCNLVPEYGYTSLPDQSSMSFYGNPEPIEFYIKLLDKLQNYSVISRNLGTFLHDEYILPVPDPFYPYQIRRYNVGGYTPLTLQQIWDNAVASSPQNESYGYYSSYVGTCGFLLYKRGSDGAGAELREEIKYTIDLTNQVGKIHELVYAVDSYIGSSIWEHEWNMPSITYKDSLDNTIAFTNEVKQVYQSQRTVFEEDAATAETVFTLGESQDITIKIDEGLPSSPPILPTPDETWEHHFSVKFTPVYTFFLIDYNYGETE